MIRAVVFDLGQVLASPPDIHSHPAGLLGVTTEDSPPATGRADQPSRRAHRTRPSGTRPDPARIAGLHRQRGTAGHHRRHDLDPDPALGRAADRRHQGVRTAHRPALQRALVLGDAIEAAPWRRHFDRVYVSALIGAAKPRREIYDHAAPTWGWRRPRSPLSMTAPENVEGALEAVDGVRTCGSTTPTPGNWAGRPRRPTWNVESAASRQRGAQGGTDAGGAVLGTCRGQPRPTTSSAVPATLKAEPVLVVKIKGRWSIGMQALKVTAPTTVAVKIPLSWQPE